MSLTKDEARLLISKILAFSKADECSVSLEAEDSANLRFASNEVTTSGSTSNVVASVTSSFGKRSGTASINQFDDASLERTVRRSEETARFAPEDPERMPMLGEQRYTEIGGFDEATAHAAPEVRAAVAKRAIEVAKSRKVVAAGFFTNSGQYSAIGNSKGLFGFTRQSLATFSSTARTTDGTGSGWAGSNSESIARFDPAALARAAVDKAFLSVRPRSLDPGTYTTILEPAAVADLLQYMTFSLDARSSDEGRSFFAVKGGGNKIGQKVLSDRFSLSSDPEDPRLPAEPFTREGLPTARVPWIEQGNVRNLGYTRFWAQKQNKEPVPSPQNLIMAGGTGSVADLIRSTKRGVLVTRLWYIRFVDPQSILLTGLTRDGTFLIENGRIKHAVKNFRWNDSPISVFSKMDAMSAAVRTRGSESEDFPIICPAIRTQFTFSSLSDAI